MLKAQSTYNTLIYSILNGNTTARYVYLYKGNELLNNDKIPLNGTNVSVGNNTQISIQDSNGMISLYTVNTGALERLIKLLLPNEKNPSVIIDSLLDWINPNPLASSPNGAGDTYYFMHDYPYAPRHYLLQYKREFELIRGMDEQKYKILDHCLTILPTTGFNPNTANDDCLRAYLDISQQSLENLKNYLKNASVTNNNTLFSLTGRTLETQFNTINFYPSVFWQINVSVLNPHMVYRLEAGISKKGSLNHPYSILYFKQY